MVSTVRIKQITDFFFFGLSWKNILQQIKKLVELVLPSFYFQSIWLTNSCPLTVYPARCWPFREVKRSWPSPEGVDGWKVFHLTIIYLNKQTKKTNKNQANFLQDDRIQLNRFTLLFRSSQHSRLCLWEFICQSWLWLLRVWRAGAGWTYDPVLFQGKEISGSYWDFSE